MFTPPEKNIFGRISLAPDRVPSGMLKIWRSGPERVPDLGYGKRGLGASRSRGKVPQDQSNPENLGCPRKAGVVTPQSEGKAQ